MKVSIEDRKVKGLPRYFTVSELAINIRCFVSQNILVFFSIEKLFCPSAVVFAELDGDTN